MVVVITDVTRTILNPRQRSADIYEVFVCTINGVFGVRASGTEAIAIFKIGEYYHLSNLAEVSLEYRITGDTKIEKVGKDDKLYKVSSVFAPITALTTKYTTSTSVAGVIVEECYVKGFNKQRQEVSRFFLSGGGYPFPHSMSSKLIIDSRSSFAAGMCSSRIKSTNTR